MRSNKQRLDKALGYIKNKNYKITSIKTVNGGINNSVYHLCDENDRQYALKIYPFPSKLDRRNRYETELTFLNYAQASKTRNVPCLIESNKSEQWAMLNWIKGSRIKKLAKDDMNSIASFISDINHPNLWDRRLKLPEASEAYVSMRSLIKTIKSRIFCLKSSEFTSDIDMEAKEWVRTELENSTTKEIEMQKGNELVDLYDKSKLVASPSDVGIHNIIKDHDKLHFIDFEYAGRDDIAKFVADWVLQPESPLEVEDENYFINTIQDQMNLVIDSNWQNRYKAIKRFIAIRWCLIMLNPLRKGTLREEQLTKAKNYFKSNCYY